MSSAAGASVEAPKGVGCGEGVSPYPGVCGGVCGGGSAPSPEFFLILDLKMSTSSAF